MKAQTGIYISFVLLTLSKANEAITYVHPPTSTKCKYTDEGTGYSGTLSLAISNNTCRLWSSYDEYTDEDFGGERVEKMSNFCRAPTMAGNSDMNEGPWCNTIDGKEYCDVHHCSETTFKSTKQCVKHDGFMSYAGKHTIPDMCLQWTDDIVQLEDMQLWQFPGSYSWSDMKDYCRNPDNDDTPWCYNKKVYESEQRLEKLYCANMTRCSTRCRVTEASLEYVGRRERSETRKPCIPAQLMIPKIFIGDEERRRWFEAKYVNDDYFIALTECRSNTDQLTADGFNTLGPVCYVNNTATSEITEESCAIHYCRGNAYNITTMPFLEDIIEQQPDTTTSAEVGEAWKILGNWSDYAISQPPHELPISTTIGAAFWTVTGLFLLTLMLLVDCSSIEKCRNRCKRNSREVSSRMKDLYGSRVSLRSNQISPDSEVADNETGGKKIKGQNSSPKTIIV